MRAFPLLLLAVAAAITASTLVVHRALQADIMGLEHRADLSLVTLRDVDVIEGNGIVRFIHTITNLGPGKTGSLRIGSVLEEGMFLPELSDHRCFGWADEPVSSGVLSCDIDQLTLGASDKVVIAVHTLSDTDCADPLLVGSSVWSLTQADPRSSNNGTLLEVDVRCISRSPDLVLEGLVQRIGQYPQGRMRRAYTMRNTGQDRVRYPFLRVAFDRSKNGPVTVDPRCKRINPLSPLQGRLRDTEEYYHCSLEVLEPGEAVVITLDTPMPDWCGDSVTTTAALLSSHSDPNTSNNILVTSTEIPCK